VTALCDYSMVLLASALRPTPKSPEQHPNGK
jgi:hypothetical protein